VSQKNVSADEPILIFMIFFDTSLFFSIQNIKI